jgi:thiol-disulfide isomerase/thioredoxin
MAAVMSKSPPLPRLGRLPAWMAAVALLSLLWPAPPSVASELEPVPGAPAAEALGLTDLGDRVHQLDDYRGQVVLVNFWATWCPPCVAEMPSLQRLYTSLSGEPFALLAVSMGENKQQIQEFGEKAGVDFPLLPDPASDVSQRWEIDFLPTSHLIDVQGRLRYTAYGELDWDDEEVRATLRTLLEQAGSGSAPAD